MVNYILQVPQVPNVINSDKCLYYDLNIKFQQTKIISAKISFSH